MKGPLLCPEMLDNSDAARVLRNSTVGHLIAFQLSFLFSFCVRPVKLLILLKMFYFRQAESCSLWLITHHFPAAAVSGSPLPLQQTHKKKVGKVHVVQAGQVKHECNCFQMWHRSAVWGVSVCFYVEMNAPESAHFLYKSSLCSLSFLLVLDYIIKIPPRSGGTDWILDPQVVCKEPLMGYRNICCSVNTRDAASELLKRSFHIDQSCRRY